MRSSYSAYKATTLKRLSRAWVLACVLAAGAASEALFWGFPQVREWALEFTKIGEKAKRASLAAGVPDVSHGLLALLFMAAAVPVAFRLRKEAAQWVFEHAFDRFNLDVWEPVRRPSASQAGDLCLPWVAPREGHCATARFTQWQELIDWVHQGALPSANGDIARPFSWALMVGRPGSGKSRTADELARHLARRDLFGDAANAGVSWKGAWRHRLFALGAAWRRARRKPRLGDPWDAGRPAHRSQGSGVELLQASQSFERHFESWRPRAPTLILFEDPRAEEAAALVNWLARKAAPQSAEQPELAYKFAVRLLVVNQSLPGDLQLQPLARGRWGSGLPHLHGGPWVVDENNYFTWPEWLELKRSCFQAEDRRPLAVAQADFVRLTRLGHPLLTEALLGWLLAQPSDATPLLDAGLTPERLLDERAERVMRALQAADVKTHPQWMLLATASLLGGMPWPETGGEAGLLPGTLQRVFPNEDVQRQIPAVRPDLIGHAFAELVVRLSPHAGVLHEAMPEVQRQTATAMAQWAWQSDPYSVLNALTKLAGRNPSSGSSSSGGPRGLLVQALEAAADAAHAGDAPTVVRAFVRHHLKHGRSLHLVESCIRRAQPVVAQAVATQHLFECLAIDAVAVRDALTVFSLACERSLSLELPAVEAAQVVEALLEAYVRLSTQLARRGVCRLYHAGVPAAGFERLGRAFVQVLNSRAPCSWSDPERCAQLLDELWASRHTDGDGLLPFLKAFQDAAPHLHPALALSARLMRFALSGNDAEAAALEAELDVMRGGSMNWRSARELTEAYALLTHRHAELSTDYDGDRTDRAKRYAAHIEHLVESMQKARPHAQDQGTLREMVTHLAQAWACATAAHLHTYKPGAAEQAEAFAHRLDLAIDRYQMSFNGASPALAIWKARAYTYVAEITARGDEHSDRFEDATKAERWVERIAQVVEPFKDCPASDRVELTQQWSKALEELASRFSYCAVSEAGSHVERYALRIEELARSVASVPLSARRLLGEHLVKAWSRAGNVYSRLNTSEGASQAERCWARAEAVVGEFAELPTRDRHELVDGLVSEWNWACSHLRDTKAADSAARAERLAVRIDQAIEPFKGLSESSLPSVVWNSAQAWVIAAEAYSLSSGPERAAQAGRCAARIAELSMHFDRLAGSDRGSLALFQAEALAAVAMAHGLGTVLPEGAALAEGCAKRVEQLVKAIPDLDKHLFWRHLAYRWGAKAWMCAAMAHSFIPGVQSARDAERCAKRAEMAAAGFDSDDRIPHLRVQAASWIAQAWSYAACAHGRGHEPESGTHAERCARHIERITEQLAARLICDDPPVRMLESQVDAWASAVEVHRARGNDMGVERCSQALMRALDPWQDGRELPQPVASSLARAGLAPAHDLSRPTRRQPTSRFATALIGSTPYAG